MFVSDYDENIIDEVSGYRWPLFALAVLWNIFPVELASLCYRFDYTRFVKKQGLSLTTDPSRGESGVPSLTHDMLPDSTSREKEESSSTGPIHLPHDAPDAFYSRLAGSPPPYADNDVSLESGSRTSIATPDTQEISTPLPSSIALPTRVPFPAFLTALAAYFLSTLFLSTLFFFSLPYFPSSSTATTAASASPLITSASDLDEPGCWDRRDEALKYLVPLLPLVTLPLTTFAVPLGLVFATMGEEGEDEEAVKELWKYEETWRAPVPKQVVCEADSSAIQ